MYYVQWLDTISLGMVPTGKRSVTPVPTSLKALVPPPEGTNENIKSSNADPIRDTVPLIKRIVKRTLYQTRKLAPKLKGSTVAETVRNNFDFVFKHIQYQKDPVGKEQVRSPRRLVYDGRGDCDCFVTFLSSLLTNQGIDHKLRITKYNGSSEFSHIYIIVPHGSGYITLDPVVHQFNHEVPFTEKKDFDMKLESLDGPEELRVRPGICIPPRKRRTYVVGQNQLSNRGIALTETVLQKNGIVFEKTVIDGKPSIITSDTAGRTTLLPTAIPLRNEKSLVTALTEQPKENTTVNSSSTAEKPYTEKQMKQAGGAVLALLALGFLASTVKGKTATGLTGAPARKLVTYQM